MEATIRNKIRLDKCGVYTAKETLGYRVRKRSSKEWKTRGSRGETNPQINNQSSPMRKREEPMEEQNRVNEEHKEKLPLNRNQW